MEIGVLEIEGMNYWAVAVAWLLNIIVGAFWYSPAGFGKAWSKLSGVDIMKLPQGEANKAIVSVALASLVQTVVLAVLINSMHITTAGDGLMFGIVLWLGLIAATTVGTTLYSRRTWKFWWLNSSFFLVVLAVNSVILAVWK